MPREKYTPEEREILEGFRDILNHLHFGLGWPWPKLPRSREYILAMEELAQHEPFVRRVGALDK